MTKSDYEKLELELILKGYELFTFHGTANYWKCGIKCSKDNLLLREDGYIKLISGYREKTVKRRMLDWYAKNKSLISVK